MASAGLTCAEEAALAGLRQLIGLVHAERDVQRRTFEQAAAADAEAARAIAAEWAHRAERARTDATACAKRAAEIMDRGSAAGGEAHDFDTTSRPLRASPPAPDSRLTRIAPQMQRHGATGEARRDPLSELSREVDTATRAAQASERASAGEADRARQAIEQNRVTLVAAQSVGVMTGFSLLLTRLNAARDSPASALALMADVLTVQRAVQSIRDEVERSLAPAVRDASRAREDLADAPREGAIATESHARAACQAVAGMERWARARDLEQREQTARAILAAKPPVSSQRDRVRPTTQAAPAALNSARAGLVELAAAIEQRAIPAPSPDLQAYSTRVDAELQGRLKGRSPADAARIRDELLAEARRRFASDPQRLSRVEALIQRTSAGR